ncbi:MAG: ATP-grasp domain-containing protein [Acidimicrobiales bacterium]
MPTVLLILPTSTYRAEEYLSAAERLGVTVVIASERRQAMAGVMGEAFLEVPLADPRQAAELLVDHGRRVTFDAVVAVDDQGLLAAALACETLGLRHSPAAAVALTRDKAAMRAAFAGAAVPQPDYEVVPAQQVARASERLGMPVVVKPASLSASRGVIRADTSAEAGAAADRIVRMLAAGEGVPAALVVERFVPGPEVAVEGMCRDGQAAVLAVFDKPDPLDGPYFEETFYVSPSRLPPSLLAAIETAALSAVHALGLTDGPFHAELRVGDSTATVKVLEVAARTIGGRCSTAMRLANGWGLEELVISNALGSPQAWPPPVLAGPCGILMIPIPRSGTLRSVNGIDEARLLPGITGAEMSIAVGRPVLALPEGSRYLGFVFAAADSAEAVEASLRRAEGLLVVDIDDPGVVASDTVT